MTNFRRHRTLIAALFCAACTGARAADDTLANAAINIAGRISEGILYRLQVDYKTTVNSAACQFDDYITGMRIARNDTRYFAPTIDGGSHQLQTSLRHASDNADDGCGWKPKVIALCLGAQGVDNGTHCQPLFILDQSAAPPAQLTLRCNRNDWICTTADNDGRLRRDVATIPATLHLDIDVQ